MVYLNALLLIVVCSFAVSTSQEHENAATTSVIPEIEQEIQPVDHNVEYPVQEDSVLPSVVPREANGTSVLQKVERDTEVVGDTLSNHGGEQSLSGPTSIRTTPRNSSAKSYIGTKLSPDCVISSIAATENIRLVCAAILAILVVIYGQMNINSTSILRGIIASRPIYLLLLTDITIVVGFLMLSGKRGETAVGGSRYTVQETGLVKNISRLLEIAVLVQKAMNAAFIDCTVYAVVLISCVCFQQYWK